MHKHTLLATLIAASVCACGGGGSSSSGGGEEPDTGLEDALRLIIDDAVLNAVERFSTQTATLNSRSETFCDALSTDNLDALQTSWKATQMEWFALANYNFGPLNDDLLSPKYTFIDSLRLRGTNYLESVRTRIADNIANDVTLDAAYFNTQTFQHVGLLALESAIFETAAAEHGQDLGDIVAEYNESPRKCEILTGLAEHLQAQSDYVQNGWTQDHKGTGFPYRTLFLAGELDDGTEPVVQLIVAVQQHLDYLQKRSVVTQSAQLAGNAWESMSSAIDNIDAMLQIDNPDAPSFFDVMTSRGLDTSVQTVQQNIAAIRQAISDRDAAMLEIELGKLDGNFKREIPDGLGVVLGINFSDGD